MTKQLKNKVITKVAISLLIGISAVSISFATSFATTAVADKTSTQKVEVNEQNPVAIVNRSFVKLQELVSEDSTYIQKNPQKLVDLVNQYFIPYVAPEYMSGMVIGPRWRNATETERKDFTQQFLFLLARFYAKSIAQVGNYKLVIHPIAPADYKGKKNISLNGDIINKSNSNSSPIQIKMVNIKNQWKVYDVVVGGVSIVNNYREQFQQAASVSQITQRLTQMNKK